jgi:hypothetical protein
MFLKRLQEAIGRRGSKLSKMIAGSPLFFYDIVLVDENYFK